ncbi:serine/threonine-protein phosphatase 6 regulatory ankyrin repeat subunit C-like [Cotesia glomerata]|uniref:serine/threonine-protein phosphatase 6 regulatory ankyrin repeat subunit C-like n=1 Tax=Cotesia glomerata TaxID=32391 RepID=UPI001D00EAB8|nr:serine/threonine-protein phosphatase 6 regulatory ankyrin repeat subunit C-like [Cotesia glomerata]
MSNPGDTPLHWAILKQNEKAVKKLLEEGADLMAENDNHQNLLRVAVDLSGYNLIEINLLIEHISEDNITEEAYLKFLNDLVDDRQNIHAQNLLKRCLTFSYINKSYPTRPSNCLWAAVRIDPFCDVVKNMLKRGVNINYSHGDDGDYRTALHIACECDNSSMGELLLKNGAAASFNDRWPFNNINLCLNLYKSAVATRHNEIIVALLDRGIDVNSRLPGSTCSLLHRAVEVNNKKIVELLISKGAYVNIEGYLGQQPISRLVDILTEHISEDNITEETYLKFLNDLVDDRQNIHAQNFLKRCLTFSYIDISYPTRPSNCLWAAVRIDAFCDVVENMLKRGVNINYSHVDDGDYRTALHVACECDNSSMGELLLKNGAAASFNERWPFNNINLCPNLYKSAVATRHNEIIVALLDRGIDVNSRLPGSSCSLLHRAVEVNNKKMIELLISKGAYVNIEGYLGQQPISRCFKRVTHFDCLFEREFSPERVRNHWNFYEFIELISQHMFKMRLPNQFVNGKDYQKVMEMARNPYRYEEKYKKKSKR